MLNSKQRQILKAKAHALKPVMHVGKGGVTPAQAAELDVMVDSLELVKVKVNPNSFEALSCRIAVGKRTLILAIVVIIIGVALIVYQDPQFRLALNSSSTSSASSSSSTRFVTGGRLLFSVNHDVFQRHGNNRKSSWVRPRWHRTRFCRD